MSANLPPIHRKLDDTDIDHLPSNGLRPYLKNLYMSGTINLKRFDAYESGVMFHNQTYPLLKKVTFFYHAHCCQMRNHRYFVGENRRYAVKRRKSSASISNVQSADIYKRDADETMEGYVCVNVTNRGSVINVAGNVTDYQIQTAAEFCSSAECIPSLCGDECTNPIFGISSGIGASEIICIEILPSSSLDMRYSLDNFTSEVTRIACNTAEISPSPTTSLSPSLSSFTIPTTPPPPDPCMDGMNWCSYEFHSPSHDADHCETCLVFWCEDQDCIDEFPDLCDCYRRKRSIMNHKSAFKRSINSNSTDNCSFSVATAVCRERLNATYSSSVTAPTPASSMVPMPTPCESSQCNFGYSVSELLLPSGWFYPEEDSKDVICRELSNTGVNVTTDMPTMPPSTLSPQNECIRHPGIVTVDITNLVEGPLTICFPEPDDFNPCEDLLGNSDVLRAAIWIVVLLALFGNGMVIVVFIGYSVIIRRTKINLFIMHFFYANLASADLLMSIYLLTIALVDAITLGHFSEDDVEWRTGPGCGFAGFCAITSTMVSVYTLVVITAERLYTITCVMRRKPIKKPIALVIMVFGWAFGICMGILPLFNVNSYELTAICLPFDTNSTASLVYISFILIFTGIAFVFIAISYGIIFYQIVLSPSKRKLVRSGGSRKKWKGELKMAFRMFLLVCTNLVCWFPIALVSLTAAFGAPLTGISIGTAKIFVVFVFPVNACLNPFLYSLSTRVFRENVLLMLSKCGLFKQTAKSTAQSRVGVPSEISNRTVSTDAIESRRTSLMTHLTSLSSLIPIRRSSDFSQNEINYSMFNQRQPSQFNMGSKDENVETSTASHKESCDRHDIKVLHNPGFLDEKNKSRHIQISGSSLGVLSEYGEASVEPSLDPSLIVNPGYLEEDKISREESHKTRDTFGNGNLVSTTANNVTIVENEMADLSPVDHHQIVAGILQTEKNEPSTSPTTSNDYDNILMQSTKSTQEQ